MPYLPPDFSYGGQRLVSAFFPNAVIAQPPLGIPVFHVSGWMGIIEPDLPYGMHARS